MEIVRIGVISDTHGNTKLMDSVCNYMIETEQVKTIYHLGDNYEDGEYLISIGFPVKVVPGLWCDQFHDWKTPKVIIEEIKNIKIALAHTLDLILKSAGKNCSIQCFGHTHTPLIKRENNKIYFNPGHLKKQIDRGTEASFGIIKFENDHIFFEIISVYNMGKVLYNLEVKYQTIT